MRSNHQPSKTSKPHLFHIKLLTLSVISSLLLMGCNDDHNEIVYYPNAPEHVNTFDATGIDNALAKISAVGKAVTPDAKCGAA